eukprot:3150337-Prymnesium_polylepis.1
MLPAGPDGNDAPAPAAPAAASSSLLGAGSAAACSTAAAATSAVPAAASGAAMPAASGTSSAAEWTQEEPLKPAGLLAISHSKLQGNDGAPRNGRGQTCAR